jgi:hypothetical protein
MRPACSSIRDRERDPQVGLGDLSRIGFNEAVASQPRRAFTLASMTTGTESYFNEAVAGKPRRVNSHRLPKNVAVVSSMRPWLLNHGMARPRHGHAALQPASMRPWLLNHGMEGGHGATVWTA